MAKFTRTFEEFINNPNGGFIINDTWNVADSVDGGSGRLELLHPWNIILPYVLKQDDRGKFPFSTVTLSAIKKSGKALWIDTPILTDSGWKTMGSVSEQDKVFSDDGKLYNVTYATETMYGHECYKVTFTNGESIIADADHIWHVGSRFLPFEGAKIDNALYWHDITTKEMVDKVDTPWGKHPPKNYSLRISKGLQFPAANLPIAPYTFGLWLGDGRSDGSEITCGTDDLSETLQYIEEEGYLPNARISVNRAPTISLSNREQSHTEQLKNSVRVKLRELGVLGNKHIPDIYKFASYEQRLEVLRGLMDSDGTIDKKGYCEFCGTNKSLVEDVKYLLYSLGIKGSILTKDAKLYGRFIGLSYKINFRAYKDEPVFKLKRKIDRMVYRNKIRPRCELIRISSIEKVESVPVKCISVDSPNHLYLAGNTLIPTHNTAMSAAIVAWYAECSPEGSQVFICANSEEQSVRLIFKDLTYHFKHRPDLGAKPLKDKITLNNDTEIIVLTRNYTSNAGGRHALVVFDELWGGTSEDDYRRYDEMTPIPTIPHSLQLITSYAGFLGESNLLHDIYLNSVGKEEDSEGKGELIPELAPLPCYRNGDAYFAYWDHEPRMPWQTPEYYDGQLKTLRPSAYLRLHENRWVTSNEQFFPIELYDKAVENFAEYLEREPMSADIWLEHPYRKNPIFIAVDTGLKHDCTAIIGVTSDPREGKIIKMFHKIWTPVDGEVLDLEETVEPYLLRMWKTFNIADIACDPSQMLQVITKLRAIGLPMTEFVQSESGMIAASGLLFDLFQQENLWTYKSEEVKEHLQNAVAQHTSKGFRIVKDKSNRRTAKKKVDAAVALAMACHRAIENQDFDMGVVQRIDSPYGEYMEKHIDPMEADLPWQLRS